MSTQDVVERSARHEISTTHDAAANGNGRLTANVVESLIQVKDLTTFHVCHVDGEPCGVTEFLHGVIEPEAAEPFFGCLPCALCREATKAVGDEIEAAEAELKAAKREAGQQILGGMQTQLVEIADAILKKEQEILDLHAQGKELKAKCRL